MSKWCFCARVVKIHRLVQEISAEKAHFHSLYSVVTLKIRSSHQHLINSFNYLNDTMHKVQEIGIDKIEEIDKLFLVKI